MTQKAIEALAVDREALLKIGAGLGDAEWGSESGCPGWSLQDVVAHLGALYWAVVDPSTLPEVGELPTERAQEVFVEQRRSWSSAQVLADYESVSIQALAALEGLADQEFEVPLGDLGTYPASVISSRVRLRPLPPHPQRPLRPPGPPHGRTPAVRRAPPRACARLGRGRTAPTERGGAGGPRSRRGDRAPWAGGPPHPTRTR